MVAILNVASRLKFGSARRAAPTLGFSIRGDSLHLRLNRIHSAAVGILFEGLAGKGEWASAVAGLIFRRSGPVENLIAKVIPIPLGSENPSEWLQKPRKLLY